MHRTRRPCDEGAAAVEFALVSVLLLTLLFGVLQYGYFFYQATAVEHAAREGARIASLGIPSAGCNTFAQTVQARAGDVDLTQVEARYTNTDLTTPGVVRGDTVRVRVVWSPTDLNFPFLPFIGPTPEDTAITRVERTNNAVPVDCVDTTP